MMFFYLGIKTMDIPALIDNKLLLAVVSLIGGAIIVIVTQFLLNKRGLFTYYVTHSRVGISADDVEYGSVKVTWNDNPIAHLYLSTIVLVNKCMKDYDSVEVQVYTNNTKLLTETTAIIGTPKIIHLTEEYKEKLTIPAGSEPTEEQAQIYFRQRDYIVPTMNRGQEVKFQFLNSAHSEEQPAIYLDILHKGVVCKYQTHEIQIYGVSQTKAALVGTVVCLMTVAIIINNVEDITQVALASFFLGLIAVIPGAYIIKLYHMFYKLLAD